MAERVMLFGLQVSIFLRYVDDARTVLMGVHVVVTDDHGVGVTPVQVFHSTDHYEDSEDNLVKNK
jgi:hypothetical protein